MTLNSRAPRAEYWWVVATLFGGILFGVFLNSALFPYGGSGRALHSWLKFAYILFILTWLLALYSVSVRRLHDVDKTGLWMALYLFAFPIAFVTIGAFAMQPGTPGPNRYGPAP